jgi:hypothetical protein
MHTDKSKSGKQKEKPKGFDKAQPGQDKEHGEGNYKASREYNDATSDFAKSGRVDDAAKKAKPRDAHEREDMERAEQAGRDESKGEDPALYRGSRKSSDA